MESGYGFISYASSCMRSIKYKEIQDRKKDEEREAIDRRERILKLTNRSFGRAFPPEVKELIKERDGNKCAMCGLTEADSRQGLQMHVDHIIEWYYGGRTTYENGQLLCQPCNSKKHHQFKATVKLREEFKKIDEMTAALESIDRKKAEELNAVK